MTQHVDFSEHDAAPSPKPPLYRLSALLEVRQSALDLRDESHSSHVYSQGHTDDVRALVGSASSDLFSSSRDGTARRWAREGAREGQTGGWKQLETYREGHEGFVNSVAWFTRAEKGRGPRVTCCSLTELTIRLCRLPRDWWARLDHRCVRASRGRHRSFRRVLARSNPSRAHGKRVLSARYLERRPYCQRQLGLHGSRVGHVRLDLPLRPRRAWGGGVGCARHRDEGVERRGHHGVCRRSHPSVEGIQDEDIVQGAH